MSAFETGSFQAGAFVGRAREMAALRARFDAAAGKHGGTALLAGEPGIGKTRIARELTGFARERGAAVLWGRAYEGDWTPPYAPWVEALSAYVRGAEPDHLRRQLGSGGALLAGLIPELGDLLPDAPPPPLGPEEERFRLYDAVTQFLLRCARDQPVLLVLDDLHWADSSSLGLLRHVARFAAGARLLNIGAYRDAGIDRGRPLGDVLADLHRERGFELIQMKGLPPDQVATFFTGVAGVVDDALVRTIAIETGGNPFFIEEVARHLWEEGKLTSGNGRLTTASLRELGVPEGVRQVVGQRVGRLSPDTSQLLTHAAVFSGGFDFPVVQDLTGFDEVALLNGIDEALAAQVLRPVDGRRERYDFVHALVRHALADTWSPSRRVRLHRQAAAALERVHGERAMEYAGELAVQYHESVSLPGADQGVRYALAAAERATAGYAREQAVVFLRMARDLVNEAGPEERSGILCRLAVAEAEALFHDDAQRTTEQALDVLEARGVAPDVVAGFLWSVAFALKTGRSDVAAWRPLVQRGLASLGDARNLTWARLTLLLDPIEPVSGEPIRSGRWRGFDPQAVTIAQADGDEDDAARTLESFDVRTPEETEALIARVHTWEQPQAILRGLTIAANDLQYRHGAFREAAELWRELASLAERYGALTWHEQALSQCTLVHVALGEFDLARQMESRAKALIARLGPSREVDASGVEIGAAFAMYLGGDWPAIADFWTRFVANPLTAPEDVEMLAGLLYGALAAFAQARAGATSEAGRLLTALSPILGRVDALMGNFNGAVAFAAGAAWELNLSEFAPAYRRLAQDLIAAGVGDYPQTSIELIVARMSALLGEQSETAAAFERARTKIEASGQRPLRAIVDYDEALAGIRNDSTALDRVEALLHAAKDAFEALGMEEWEQRAEALLAEAAERLAAAGMVLPAGLTEREADVLRLVTRGYSDRRIADELFISPRTVNAHMRNMFGKTGATNRTDLSVWATEHGLATRGDEHE